MDYTINLSGVNDVASVNPAMQPVTKRQVTYYIGKRGPFYLLYDIASYSAETVIADIQKEVSMLKAVDAGLGVS